MNNNLLINLSFLIPQATGISTYAKNIIPHLQQLNPTLLTPQNLPPYKNYPVPANMTPDQGSKGHLRRILWTQFQLPQLYKNLQSNLLFSPLPEAPIFTKTRYIVTVHDLIPLRFSKPFSRLTSYFRYYIPQVLSQAEHIICDSESTAKDINKFYKISLDKTTVIPLAYDKNNFRDLNLPTSNYFLYIGRHDPYKNLHRLIEAFANLPRRPNYELWISGPTDTTYTPQLQAKIVELNLTESVKLIGYASYEKLPTLINQAIALVFPSLWEGFGLPVLEAMACGTPVITSNVSSLPEVAGSSALMVNPYNTAEITAAMDTVANDTQQRSYLREQGLIQASQFSWEKTGLETAKILKKYL